MSTLSSLFLAIPWFAWLAILGIICGTVIPVVAVMTKHRERMGMIRMGIHPDAKIEKPHYEEQEV